MTRDEFDDMKRELETLKSKLAKAEGAHEQTMLRLNKEHDCPTIKDAKKLHKKLQEENEEKKQQFEKALKEYTDERNNRT